MSTLYTNEEGRVIPTLCEELTTYRRAQTVLNLPSTASEGTLYLLARSYAHPPSPLRISINEIELEPVLPASEGFYLWYAVPVAPSILRTGSNVVEVWTDATAMNAWSLALEAGHGIPESAISDDGGRTWRHNRMGYLNAVCAEYVIRIRLEEGNDTSPPPIIWEDPAHPRLASLRRVIPDHVRSDAPLMDRVRKLASWIAMSWEHSGASRPAQYTPWDAETILTWGRHRSGHSAQRPIVMCVHYAVAFVTACQALGIPARCAVLMGTPNGTDGHFVSEVWFEEYKKWVMVDPNTDAIFQHNGTPLSITDIQQAGDDLSEMVEWGAGYAFQKTFPHMSAFIRNNLLKGVCFRHRSIWPYMNLLSRPELSPPGHGSVSYCETDLVWESGDLERGFGMFRYFADSEYFDTPPAHNHL